MNTDNELKEAIDQLEVAIDAWIDKAARLKLERDAAREECEFTSRLAETMTKQRDTLAEALRDAVSEWRRDQDSYSITFESADIFDICIQRVEEALAALELPSGNNNAQPHDNTDNVTEQEPPFPDK